MWLKRPCRSYQIFLGVLAFSYSSLVECDAITNANFNENIRNYSVNEDIVNSTNVKTLQMQGPGRYANLAPVRNPIRFKEIPDNALSSSSYSRGLLHHDHSGKISRKGYGLHDYEDGGHYGYGYHDEHHDYDHHYGHHDLDHHHGHHDDHHDHHGHHHHHHKHFDHALAAKAVLWPLAGIAFLGAAAALVSNPVILQLGAVSGRKRRDAEEVADPIYLDQQDLSVYQDFVKRDSDVVIDLPNANKNNDNIKRESLKKRVLKTSKFLGKVHPKQSPVNFDSMDSYYSEASDDRYIPIPLILKNNLVNTIT